MALELINSPKVHQPIVIPMMKAFFPGVRVLKDAMPDGTHDTTDGATFGAGFVRPKYTPASWMALVRMNTRLQRCVDVRARSSVGLGFDVVPAEDWAADARNRRNIGYAVDRDAQALLRLTRRPNPSGFDPLTEIYFRIEKDRGATGNGFQEVVEEDRAAGNPVENLDHVPCVTMRVNRERDKYVRTLVNGRKIYFRRFGDDDPAHKFMDKSTGQFFRAWPSDLPFSRRATSIIHHKTYCPFDDYYGQPFVAPAIHAVWGDYMAEVWGVNLLRNNAHVPMAIIVENGNLTSDSMEQIEAFMSREANGIENAGRIMVLQPDLTRMSIDGGLKLRLEKLDVGVKEDALFSAFKGDCRNEIQESAGLSDVYMGGGMDAESNTRNAATLRQITQEHTINPITDYHETVFNEHIAPNYAGGKAALRWKRASNLDAVQRAAVVDKLSGGLTVDDVREVGSELLQRPYEPLGGKLGKTLVLIAAEPAPALPANPEPPEKPAVRSENSKLATGAA